MANILIADDDGHIREVVRYALEKAGYRVLEAADGAEALGVIEDKAVDLVVLDIIMPGEDGLQVCRQVAAKGDVPVIFLTSRDEEVDRVLGLELGADDYVTKPFSPRELVARVGAVLRRTSRTRDGDDSVLSLGRLELDVERHRCRWDGSEVDLTVTEFAVLRTLLAMPGKVYTRVELVDRAYGHDHHVTERTIDSHIRRIRKKLGDAGADDPIETVHGLGYRMRV
ncbi:MAG: response regulator transcription factor [Deltaproteobacteria bacterium]|nr:response regulator transcription factor [Deltaproteobacteria bacterium]